MTHPLNSLTEPLPPDDPAASCSAPVAKALIWLSHRAGSLALLLLVCGLGAVGAGRWVSVLFLWAFGCADLGLLAAAVAAVMRTTGGRGREALGPGIFNLVVLLAALGLYLAALMLREI